jgi:hypothetical protein
MKTKKYRGGGQGYADREDESLGMRTGAERTKRQSMRDRRDESYGAWGKRPNQRINRKDGGVASFARGGVEAADKEGSRLSVSMERQEDAGFSPSQADFDQQHRLAEEGIAVLKAIRQRIELTEQAILAGSPKTLEDYRQLTGELKGLQFAEQEIKDALDKTEKEES